MGYIEDLQEVCLRSAVRLVGQQETWGGDTMTTTTIEQMYQARMASLLPKERVARSMAMLHWTRALLARQIRKTHGEMPAERLKWEVAKRIYGADPRARALIERELADVSG